MVLFLYVILLFEAEGLVRPKLWNKDLLYETLKCELNES